MKLHKSEREILTLLSSDLSCLLGRRALRGPSDNLILSLTYKKDKTIETKLRILTVHFHTT